MITKLVLILAVAASALTVAGPASANVHHHRKWVGSCHAQGEYAICVASGTANHPRGLWVHVTSRPHQHVSGAWSTTCSKGLGAGGKSGRISGRTPFVRRLKMAYRRPDMCIVAADAQLSRAGNSIRIWITTYK